MPGDAWVNTDLDTAVLQYGPSAAGTLGAEALDLPPRLYSYRRRAREPGWEAGGGVRVGCGGSGICPAHTTFADLGGDGMRAEGGMTKADVGDAIAKGRAGR